MSQQNSKRHVRLRREFLYRKAHEARENRSLNRKLQIKAALEQGKKLPTELQRQGNRINVLRKELRADDALTLQGKSHVDDEYAFAGVTDPKVCVTTSRDPSSRLKRFAKEVKLLFPNAQRVNRGTHRLDEIVDACRNANFTDMIILHENRGEPDRMTISHLPYGPTAHFSLSNCVMRLDALSATSTRKRQRDDEIAGRNNTVTKQNDDEDEMDDAYATRATVSEAYPHLVFHNFTTSLGDRVSNILKYLYPVPKPDSKRIMTFYNDGNFISFRHHIYHKPSGEEGHPNDVELEEVGPRFEMRPYEIRLGTADQQDAEVEWALASYTNAAKKRKSIM